MPEIAGVVAATENDPESDLRPHYFDPIMKRDLLIDSGSQVTAFPPEPGDIEDSNVILKAVNGTKIKTFGFKDITVKINRKPYKFRAIKAEVETPVIGWDFMRTHRLDMRWGEFGVVLNERGGPLRKKLGGSWISTEKDERI